MPIFNRHNLSIYPPFLTDGSGLIGLTEEKKSDPFSIYFQYPDWLLPLNAPKLVSWLKECHEKAGLPLLLPWGRHLKQAKELTASYGYDDLIKAVKRASQLSKYPFTFSFVRRVLDENL